MKHNFLSQFDAENLRKTITYFVIGLSLIIVPIVLGINKNDLVGFMFFFGFIFFLCSVASLGKCKILWDHVHHIHYPYYTNLSGIRKCHFCKDAIS